jgi:hypothetical protein
VLTWKSQPLGVSLAFDEAGRQVGWVRRWRNGWEAHFDANGLDRPPAEPRGSRRDEGYLVGRFASAGEARRAVERHHDRPGAQPP